MVVSTGSMARALTVTALGSALAIACAHGSGHPCPRVTVPMGVEGLGATAPTAFELPTRVSECMDCSVDPCQDFHRYACGRWIAAFDSSKPMAATGVAEVMRQHERRLDAIYTKVIVDTDNERCIDDKCADLPRAHIAVAGGVAIDVEGNFYAPGPPVMSEPPSSTRAPGR